jgi:hypothetical protein
LRHPRRNFVTAQKAKLKPRHTTTLMAMKHPVTGTKLAVPFIHRTKFRILSIQAAAMDSTIVNSSNNLSA